MPKRYQASLFKNGGSQALRLPRECRMPGTRVASVREENRLIVEPIDRRGWSKEFLEMISTPSSADLFAKREQPKAQVRDFEP